MCPCFGVAAGRTDPGAECTGDVKRLVEGCVKEIPDLARAGVQGLDVILDMLADEKDESNKWKNLSTTEKSRYKEIFITFFGAIRKKREKIRHRTQINKLRSFLNRMAARTPETWPKGITYWCDSTWNARADNDGKGIYEARNQEGVVMWKTVSDDDRKRGLKPKFDTVRSRWYVDFAKADCQTNPDLRAFCTTFCPDQADADATFPEDEIQKHLMSSEERDRITTCPRWQETYLNQQEVHFTDPQVADGIKDGEDFVQFVKKATKTLYHEHLHCGLFNGCYKRENNLVGDHWGDRSYGPENAMKIAARLIKDPHGDSLTNALDGYCNVENVVYWCIANYFHEWDWSTLKARRPKEDSEVEREPGDIVKKAHLQGDFH